MAMIKIVPVGKDYLWGGRRLVEQYGKQCKGDILAESWELSCHPDGPSLTPDGITLEAYLDSLGGKPLGENCTRFGNRLPVLIKLIDAAAPLSIQVHPSNDYAREHEGQDGKTEVWHILDCEPGAFIYYGVNRELTRDQLAAAVEDGTLVRLLKKTVVEKGDTYFIEAGTIHAIGQGIVIAEIQQNSNVTYRVYDYDRRDPSGALRQLHRRQAVEVSRLTPNPGSYDFGGHMAFCDYFCVDRLSLEGGMTGAAGTDSFVSLLVTDGEGKVACGGKTIDFCKGDSILITAGSGEYRLEGRGEILKTTIPAENKQEVVCR